ncbi:MAG: hypothetical protein HZB98_03570 [Bacteroidia bacterium]|nr:hypothetical protein [Bacteroidia bacterium]
MKKHLLEGVKKGAFDEAEANRRFDEWMKQNEAKIEAKKSGLEKSQEDSVAARLKQEKKVNDARAAKLARKKAELDASLVAEIKEAASGEEADQVEDAAQEPAAETPAEENPQA